jgi:hypothetical protein
MTDTIGKREQFQHKLDTLSITGKPVSYKAEADGFFNIHQKAPRGPGIHAGDG